MLLAAERLKEAAVSEFGGIVAIDGEHCARVKYADTAGKTDETKGPRRGDERRAQTDLKVMRAAAADKSTRAERLEAIATEAQRLHDESEAGGVDTIDGEHEACDKPTPLETSAKSKGPVGTLNAARRPTWKRCARRR